MRQLKPQAVVMRAIGAMYSNIEHATERLAVRRVASGGPRGDTSSGISVALVEAAAAAKLVRECALAISALQPLAGVGN